MLWRLEDCVARMSESDIRVSAPLRHVSEQV
jgi:hypothetical protein